MTKFVTVVGARPQFVKAAVLSRALRARTGAHEILVHTGQHFDANMSDVFLNELEIGQPSHFLAVNGGSHGEMTGRMMAALEPVMVEERPDFVLVYGDTNSTLAGALVAAKLHIPVAHVEAGLRSFNRRMPEEINRVMTDHLSQWLLCPTTTAVHNLGLEGIRSGVSHVGDVMFDAAIHARQLAREKSDILNTLELAETDFILATIHRAENLADRERAAEVVGYLDRLAADEIVVLPLHPGTRAALARHDLTFSNVRTINPIGHVDFAALLDACKSVVTDSGGVQKEAYFFSKRCVTLREETEWVETIQSGWNRLWTSQQYACEPRPILDYGTGDAANAALNALGL